MKRGDLIVLIYDALYRIGFKADCTGFFFLSYSTYLCLYELKTCNVISERLHFRVAEHYNTTPDIVEQHIHSTILKVWSTNPWKLNQLGEHCSATYPSETEIIQYLYQSMENQCFLP